MQLTCFLWCRIKTECLLLTRDWPQLIAFPNDIPASYMSKHWELQLGLGQYDSIYRAKVKMCQPVEILLFCLYCGRDVFTAIIRQDCFTLFTHDREETTGSNVKI